MPGVMFVEFSQQTQRVFMEIHKPQFAPCFIAVCGCPALFPGPAALKIPHLQRDQIDPLYLPEGGFPGILSAAKAPPPAGSALAMKIL